MLKKSLLALSLLSVAYAENPDSFVRKFLTETQSCSQKQEVDGLLSRLMEQGETLESGSDDLRINYVSAQGCIEHMLACMQAIGEIKNLVGAIHTPNPATPLCALPEGSVSDLLDASIRDDARKLYTVRSRTQIVREFLAKGGKLYIAYPQGGLEKRTLEQQTIYKNELKTHPETLFDCVLNTPAIDADLIGATYLFQDKEGHSYAFSIKARQANDIHSQSEWGLWFGPLENPKIQARVDAVFDSLASLGAPDLRDKGKNKK